MKEFKLIEDLKLLTNVSNTDINKLVSLLITIIASNILESSHDLDSLTSIDIGLGNLIVDLSAEEIRYLFTPSLELQEKIKEAIQKNIDPLTNELSKEVKDIILKCIRELLT